LLFCYRPVTSDAARRAAAEAAPATGAT